MIWETALAMGVPSAITAFCIWLLKRHIDSRESHREQTERARKELDVFILKSINASIALSEATAKAVQRIPDAHCNGDMHAALEYATKIKHEQKDFLVAQGIEHLHND